jgi:hypothetical protein
MADRSAGEPPRALFVWHPDDQLVIEVQNVAQQLGFTLTDAVSFLVGLGIAKGNEIGLLNGRATTPMEPDELFARLAAYLLEDDGPTPQ